MTKNKFLEFAQETLKNGAYKSLKVELNQVRSPRNNRVWFEIQLIGRPGFIGTNSWTIVKFSDEEKAKAALPKYQAWLEETGLVEKPLSHEQIAAQKAEFEAMFGPESDWPAER